ncbi:MAG: aminopeptidase P N-terminal domain-containing protein, partial [Candidatus Poribacteria bacterium]
DFYYLTGFEEPNAVCLLAPEYEEHKFVLFVQPKDPKAEIWTGRRAGVEGAKEQFGADEAYPIDKLDEELSKYLDNVSKIYYRMGKDEEFNQKIIDLIKRYQPRRQSDKGPHTIVDSGEILHEMRLKKSTEEIELTQKAVDITVEAQRAAMKTVKPGMYEYELEALINYIYLKNGAVGPAYPPIVASGPNAIYLHYDANNRQIQDGDLVLIDTGAEYGYYDADVTRTIPANGKFSGEQKTIYNIVLEAQLQLIESIKPGNSYEDYNQTAVRAITEGLVEIGLLSGDVEELIESKEYMKFYMHSAGHWLGLDTHDVGKYKIRGKSRAFEPGMIITPDTAIYIAGNTEGVDTRYWNIGIRIEDNALVTETGCEILSSDLPKTVEEIERFMRKR